MGFTLTSQNKQDDLNLKNRLSKASKETQGVGFYETDLKDRHFLEGKVGQWHHLLPDP